MHTEESNGLVAQFVRNVRAEFDLAPVVAVAAMAGSANRLWQLTTQRGLFVVKELPDDDAKAYSALCQAARFEATLLSARVVPGPRPVPNRRGAYVARLTDSRGQTSPIRLHHWLAGAAPQLDDLATLVQAGRTLRAIQNAGSAWSVRPASASLLYHHIPSAVLEEFCVADHIAAPDRAALQRTVADALALVHAGEALPGDWIFTHCDHKPENCLVQNGTVAVLDWDECRYCHPRLEAVESALRWAGGEAPNPARFAAFMTGYQAAGRALEPLAAPDFAKWIAGLLDWFCFQARQAMETRPAITLAERATAAMLARDALATLQATLAVLPRWTRFL